MPSSGDQPLAVLLRLQADAIIKAIDDGFAHIKGSFEGATAMLKHRPRPSKEEWDDYWASRGLLAPPQKKLHSEAS